MWLSANIYNNIRQDWGNLLFPYNFWPELIEYAIEKFSNR